MVDAGLFIRNQNKYFPPDVMRPYIGYVIAWSIDGTRMLAFARDYDELYAEMNRRGIKDFVGDGSLAQGDPFPDAPKGVAQPVNGDRS